MEEFDKEDKDVLESELESLIKSAFDFYDSEINSIDKYLMNLDSTRRTRIIKEVFSLVLMLVMECII